MGAGIEIQQAPRMRCRRKHSCRLNRLQIVGETSPYHSLPIARGTELAANNFSNDKKPPAKAGASMRYRLRSAKTRVYLQVAIKPVEPELPVIKLLFALVPRTDVGTLLFGSWILLNAPF